MAPATQEPTPDQICTAILLMISTLKLIKNMPGLPFRKNVEEAITNFDEPELRTSLVERLYHPEKYFSSQKPEL